MQTVFETRKTRLAMLVKKHGSVADLNRAMGWETTNARLYQIHNGSIRKDRGTPYEMGDTTAREIEEKLSLGLGWMDTPPSYAELHGEDDPRSETIKIMQDMSNQDAYRALAVVKALKTIVSTQTHAATPPATSPAEQVPEVTFLPTAAIPRKPFPNPRANTRPTLTERGKPIPRHASAGPDQNDRQLMTAMADTNLRASKTQHK